jgi:endonuclease/exonuclease/phosphatase family metal-dependent hydrolase
VTRPPVVDQRASVSRARLPAAIGWLTVAPPAVSAAARVARLDESSTLLILADGLTALMVPPALLALGIGLRQRSRALTLLSAATAVVLLWTTIPAIGLPDRAPPPAGTSPALRLFTANLHAANSDVGPIAEEIRAAAPDLVALQEVDHDAVTGLLRSGVLARFPYRVTEIRNGPPGIALWSRFPLADPEVLDTGGMPRIRATVLLGARRLRFYNVHVVAPVGEDRARWQAELRRVGEELRRERGPLVVAGDFNATRHHPSFRRLLRHRLADVHERRGRGWATTWPRDRWPLPPLMRLDHVLVSPDIWVRSGRASARAATTGRSSPSSSWVGRSSAQPPESECRSTGGCPTIVGRCSGA